MATVGVAAEVVVVVAIIGEEVRLLGEMVMVTVGEEEVEIDGTAAVKGSGTEVEVVRLGIPDGEEIVEVAEATVDMLEEVIDRIQQEDNAGKVSILCVMLFLFVIALSSMSPLATMHILPVFPVLQQHSQV
ncbi:hypothetical protein NECAME_10803 [Necator americanus]|uniref:Uncharacterized protein n=1 Tax=Necator americanus TaxID=51031 RepID=W2T7H0_NECAM|nr:hypothetical protein NECAME_10803 [Necator americanus]ETN77793.1 hypothetical protein NECAME_10803 [Necator americanus]